MGSRKKKAKPTRSRTHELEDESYTKFRAARPSAWPVHKIDGSDDYGRDLLVEVFEDGQPTGNEFSVQLKAREKLTGAPKVKLKLTTLNHWDDQPSPTLIVLWDAATDQLYYEWAHRLPWHEPTSDKRTRTVPVPHLWTRETPRTLAEEADAFRKVRDLGRYLPVDVEVTGSDFFGEDAGPTVAAIIDALTPFPAFSVTFTEPRVPYVRIEVLPNGVQVSMSGTPVKEMSYGAASPPPPEVVAGDVLFALAFAVGTIGRSRDVGAELLRASVRESFMAIVAGRLTDAIVILAQVDARDELKVLLGRTLGIEDHPNWVEALRGIEVTKWRMPADLRLELASALEDRATNWQRPAPLLRTAAWLVGPLNAERATRLWDAAVEADPATRESPRYWSERGGINFLSGQWHESVASYREAVRLGEESSRPLLADALMWAGRYADALREFERSGITDADDHAEYRLKMLALKLIVNSAHVHQQDRDDFIAEMRWRENRPAEPSAEFLEEVLAIDALHGWAWWAMCPRLREQGDEAVGPLLVASVCLLNFAPLWQELATASLRTGDWEIARDALLVARRTCGPDFIRLVHTDKIIDRGLRTLLLKLWGALDDRDAFYSVLYRLHAEQASDQQTSPRS